jgi:hypothetical protein
MAFKLTKSELAQRVQLARDLQEAWNTLEDAKNQAEDEIQTTMLAVDAAAQGFQSLVSATEAFRETIAERLREEWDGNSEGWQEGDNGEEASQMVEEWESASFEVEMNITPPDIDLGDGDTLVNTLEDLPVEV